MCAERKCHGHSQLRHTVGGIPGHVAHANTMGAAVSGVHAIESRCRKANQFQVMGIFQVAFIQPDLIGHDHFLIRDAFRHLLRCGACINRQLAQLLQR